MSSASRSPSVICRPGTSKWNKIEHRLFSFITQNWRGKPLVTHEVIVSLIAATTTTSGLPCAAASMTHYAKGRASRRAARRACTFEPHAFHGEWNYTIHPSLTA